MHLIIDHFFNRFLIDFHKKIIDFLGAPNLKNQNVFNIFSDLATLLLGCLLAPNLAVFWEGFGKVLGGKLDLKS